MHSYQNSPFAFPSLTFAILSSRLPTMNSTQGITIFFSSLLSRLQFQENSQLCSSTNLVPDMCKALWGLCRVEMKVRHGVYIQRLHYPMGRQTFTCTVRMKKLNRRWVGERCKYTLIMELMRICHF